MAICILFLISVSMRLCLAAEGKSHDVYISKVEDAELNSEWVVDETYKLNKVDKNRKTFDLNFTLLQEVNKDNMMCQLKVFQKNGGKYVKAPFDIPTSHCCKLIDDNGMMWRCLRDKSNVPEKCPISKGEYKLKDFDPDVCDYPKLLPPNGAENYKIEFTGSVGPTQVFKHVAYGVVKKRMSMG